MQMKYVYAILILIFGLAGCLQEKERFEWYMDNTQCDWWEKAEICICYGDAGNAAWMIYVPDKVCKKNIECDEKEYDVR